MNHISRTYVLIDVTDEDMTVTGYFTLAMKCIAIGEGMSVNDEIMQLMNVNRGVAQSYLIGQLSKADGCEKGKGKSMIEQALQIFQMGRELFGCSMVRLDGKMGCYLIIRNWDLFSSVRIKRET